MIDIPEEGVFVPIDNVKAVPRDSEDTSIKPDPIGDPRKKKNALSAVAKAVETVLAQEPDQQHLNRGLRAKAILKMPGSSQKEKEKAWEAGFQGAGLGKMPNERARIARLQEIFPEKFEKVNAGNAGERIMLT